MQTRCISCGNTIEGVAQFCRDCQARQDALAGPATRSDMPAAPSAPPAVPHSARKVAAPTSHAADYVFLVLIGGGIVAAVLWLLALGGLDSLGLGSDESPAAVQASPTMGPMPTSAPLGYAVAECGFQVPEGATAECGRLTVPQVRARPDAGTVTLPVAIFRAPAGGRQPDAVIYLDGGPGGNTLENASALYEVFKPFVANRDLILFDQRGTGGSDPSLDCPEIDQLNYDLLEQQFSVDERVAQDGETTSECHGRLLSDGINPAYATSVENAADVNDLRAALGYAQWNLLGISYGTKLALTVMRDYPGGVRSAILDSTYPPNVDAYAEFGSDFSRALNQMFDSCAGDPVCGGAFPDLRQAYDDVVRTLNERPANVAIGSLTGRPIEGAVIDGLWFSAFVFQSLYSDQLIPILPQTIFDTRDGDYELLTILADFYLQNAEGISQGMYLSVQCGEEVPFTDRDAAIAAAQADPMLQEYNEYTARSIFASCDAWGAPSADVRENTAVQSGVPALVLAGEFDPITPPSWGRAAAEGLSNGHFFEYPGLGHGVSIAHECPRAMVVAFLGSPNQAPPSLCIGAMSGLDWVVE